MNITINQITNQQETVPNTVLTKILTVKRNGGLVNLTGNIYIPAAYVNEVLEFCTYFGLTEDENTPGTYRGNDIILSVGTNYISFEDDEVARIINGTFGSDGHITLQQARDTIFTSSTFKNNTVIQTFPEFDLFTKANTNPQDNLFKNCTNLNNIDQSNMTKLSNQEFYKTGITTVNMPNLQSVSGHEQFFQCPNLTEVQSLGNALSLGNTMFFHCNNLESVILPSSLTLIPVQCFYECSKLQTINLQNLITIQDNGFRETDLSNVNVETDLQNIVNLGKLVFLITNVYGIVNFPKLISMGAQVFDRCPRITGVKNLGKISNIPDRSFFGTNITYAKIPYECTTIGGKAFSNCPNLTTIKQYTDSVDNWVEGETPAETTIGRVTVFAQECFYNDQSLSIDANDLTNAITIGSSAFFNCTGLTGTLNLPNLTSLGASAFQNTDITSITDLGNVTIIPDYCFAGCTSLTSVDFTGIVTAGYHSFEGCISLSLNASNIPDRLGEAAFKGCVGITGDLNSSTMQVLNNYSLYGTGISSITNTGSVTSIPKWCFMNCTSLTNVTLSSLITVIDDNCFGGCTSLEWVKILYTGDNDHPRVAAGVDCFDRTGYFDHNTNIKIFVPDNRVNDYKNASWFWNKYSSQIYPLSDFSTYFPNA